MINAINAFFAILQIEFTLMGYTMSLQDIILTLIFGGIIIMFLGGLFK